MRALVGNICQLRLIVEWNKAAPKTVCPVFAKSQVITTRVATLPSARHAIQDRDRSA